MGLFSFSLLHCKKWFFFVDYMEAERDCLVQGSLFKRMEIYWRLPKDHFSGGSQSFVVGECYEVETSW